MARTPQDAFRAYLEPLNTALRCVSETPLVLQERATPGVLRIDERYSLAINDMAPVQLRGEIPIALVVGRMFRIVDRGIQNGDFGVETERYFYSLLAPNRSEILSFQWTPDATQGKTFPHLHVGRAVVSDKTLVLPERFHKVHVPTGHVTLAAVIRLAIEEFRVKPLARRWRDALTRAERAEVAGPSS